MEAVEFGAFARDGIIEIPAKYRKDYSTQVRVILFRNNRDEGSTGYSAVSTRENVATTESAFGCFSRFADPSKIPLEKGAWERAVLEKYAKN